MNERESQEHAHQAAPGTSVASRASEVSELEAGAAPTELEPPEVPTGVDWLGLALDLEAQAKRVESQTTERVMLAAARGLRLMGNES
jgi:carotenoid cleavage dioxygenase-like enzyme